MTTDDSDLDREWGSDQLRDAWVSRTTIIGEAAAPLLEALCDEIEEIIVAAVSTGDGFNLCAIGLEEDEIGRFVALGSSLNSVAQAAVGALPDTPRKVKLDVATAIAGDLTLLSVTFDHETLGTCILTAAGRDISLGRLKLEAEQTAAALSEALQGL